MCPPPKIKNNPPPRTPPPIEAPELELGSETSNENRRRRRPRGRNQLRTGLNTSSQQGTGLSIPTT